MERHLGRLLETHELVHHRRRVLDANGKLSNRLAYLELLPGGQSEHVRRHIAEGDLPTFTGNPRPWQAKPLVPCPVCGTPFKTHSADGLTPAGRPQTCSQGCGQRQRYASERARLPHGLDRYRRAGCRCAVCRAANTAKAREHRARVAA
jgi:hypothetical protein